MTTNARTGAAPHDPLLAVRGVTLQYKTKEHLVTATYRVDFDVHRSDRFILLGPSGCGKSTLLKAVGGYLKPIEGDIRLKGETVTRPGPDRMQVDARSAIGIALCPGHGDDPDELLRRAKVAMHRAASQGGHVRVACSRRSGRGRARADRARTRCEA